jgi:hypothetical protein
VKETNRVLRRTFEPERGDVTGKWKHCIMAKQK